MEVKLVGSTNRVKKLSTIKNFGAASARICYSAKDFDVLLKEDKEALIQRTLKTGHHSVNDHFTFNFYMVDIPKFGAMILNNERMYTTSEKSARYTQMRPSEEEKRLYDKWKAIFSTKIKEKYPKMDDEKVGKLAQENARYLTSVFTPTKMLHTLGFRQLNYIMHFFQNFIETGPDSRFNEKAKVFMDEFNQIMQPYHVEALKYLNGKEQPSIFAKRKKFAQEFGENYSVTYPTSFACLGQLHRHRTIGYEMQPILDDSTHLGFFVPPILNGSALEDEWRQDLESIAENFPQGQLIEVHEAGQYTAFMQKMAERRCGHAQLEIMLNCNDTLDKFLKGTKGVNQEVHDALLAYAKGPRCTVKGLGCRDDQCFFGPKYGIDRAI